MCNTNNKKYDMCDRGKKQSRIELQFLEIKRLKYQMCKRHL